MLSNQILQNTIDGIKSISRVDIYVTDTDGKLSREQALWENSSVRLSFPLSHRRLTRSPCRSISFLKSTMKTS